RPRLTTIGGTAAGVGGIGEDRPAAAESDGSAALLVRAWTDSNRCRGNDERIEDEEWPSRGGVLVSRDDHAHGVVPWAAGVGLLLLDPVRRRVGVELVHDDTVDRHRGDPGVGLLYEHDCERRAAVHQTNARAGLAAVLGAAARGPRIRETRPAAAEGEVGVGVLIGTGTDDCGGRWNHERVENYEWTGRDRILGPGDSNTQGMRPRGDGVG